MAEYTAFLRGINNVKSSRVKMEDLREAFEDIGFENVRTVIASGNVIFESPSENIAELERKIEDAIPEAFGFQTAAFVMTLESLRRLAKSDPFKKAGETSRGRPFVTFINGEPKNDLKFPMRGRGFTILGIVGNAVSSVVDPAGGKTSDLMREVDKQWLRNTTRGWNTIERILK